MKLFHGSNTVVDRPDVARSRDRLDFGRGFYLTSVKKQAELWARRKAMRAGGRPLVNVYDFTEGDVSGNVLVFEQNDREWVKFVCSCRRGESQDEGFDLIAGGVADDQVYRAVDLYYKGLWTLDRTIEELSFYDRNDQYCFKSQPFLDRTLVFEEAYEVTQ